MSEARIIVPDDGDREARIALVGEAPGEEEERKRRPFVGPSGIRLADWMRKAGLARTDLYITNVVPWRPPGNKIKAVPAEEMAKCKELLHLRLASLHDPYVIVPTGATALEAITGHHEITKYRGSILAYKDRTGRTLKVIPTLHPAYTFRSPKAAALCVADWRRIREDSEFKELRIPERDHRINPSIDDVRQFAAQVEEASPFDLLAIDIETPRDVVYEAKKGKNGKWTKKRVVGKAYIGCVGFALSATESFTVPTTLKYWKTHDRLAEVLRLIKRICESKVEKTLQNGLFDCFWLKSEFGINVANFKWDPRYMHHALHPSMPHDLATLGSLYTRQPFWKDEAKDPDEVMKYANNTEALWTYNGIDCCVTWVVCRKLQAELCTSGMMDFYLHHYAAVLPVMLDIMLHGIRIDRIEMEKRRAELDLECQHLEKQLTEIVGYPLHATKGLSTHKLKKYLYEDLGLPKQYKRNTHGQMAVTTDEVAVRRLMVNHPGKLGEAGPLILRHREARKQAEFLDPDIADDDDRMRCSLSLATDAGRFASSSNPRGTGRNLQNIDRKLRDIFLPD